jgi:hypothetical protein
MTERLIGQEKIFLSTQESIVSNERRTNMTNLEIIKYLATNNPTRLADFLNEICYDAWDFGRLHRTRPITDWDEWLQADPKTTWDFNLNEIEKWSKAINPTPTIEAFYGAESKVINQAIDEIKLLENVIETTKHPGIDYVRFRKSVCAYCPDPICMRSQVEICDCHKFKNYY